MSFVKALRLILLFVWSAAILTVMLMIEANGFTNRFALATPIALATIFTFSHCTLVHYKKLGGYQLTECDAIGKSDGAIVLGGVLLFGGMAFFFLTLERTAIHDQIAWVPLGLTLLFLAIGAVALKLAKRWELPRETAHS